MAKLALTCLLIAALVQFIAAQALYPGGAYPATAPSSPHTVITNDVNNNLVGAGVGAVAPVLSLISSMPAVPSAGGAYPVPGGAYPVAGGYPSMGGYPGRRSGFMPSTVISNDVNNNLIGAGIGAVAPVASLIMPSVLGRSGSFYLSSPSSSMWSNSNWNGLNSWNNNNNWNNMNGWNNNWNSMNSWNNNWNGNGVQYLRDNWGNVYPTSSY
eukprot:TRINITY_DN2291_c0_g1_i1.p3 TRINITY_DN2291_c0_g1~~TRINITY_DN2291_c0_g1_i1.p3  ORF type:complete len:212 (+),score=55.12 TRINITY_DN2291_c0_g1_i1:1281-1916(+)